MAEPFPLCHLNGQLLPLREARISPLDRSFLFGDGVYEVIAVHGGHAPQLAANIARLARSLGELKIRNPYQAGQWAELIRELAAAHGIPWSDAAVSEAALRGADEVWLSASTRGVVPVTRLDGQPVGDGRPGPVWKRMRALVEASWLPG